MTDLQTYLQTKLRGILSEGMILCASDEQGNLKLVTHEGDLPAGAEVR